MDWFIAAWVALSLAMLCTCMLAKLYKELEKLQGELLRRGLAHTVNGKWELLKADYYVKKYSDGRLVKLGDIVRTTSTKSGFDIGTKMRVVDLHDKPNECVSVEDTMYEYRALGMLRPGTFEFICEEGDKEDEAYEDSPT